MRVVGIDPSLTGTGMALVGEGSHNLMTFPSKGKATDNLSARYERLRSIQVKVVSMVTEFYPSLVLIEQPAFSKMQGHTHDRSGLWWLIVSEISMDFPVMEVTPNNRAKYATGKGNASKDEVLLAVARRYPGVEITNNNEADAWILAMMGLRLTGNPQEVTIPQTHIDALKTSVLPEAFHG